jgi:hypothetical protein
MTAPPILRVSWVAFEVRDGESRFRVGAPFSGRLFWARTGSMRTPPFLFEQVSREGGIGVFQAEHQSVCEVVDVQLGPLLLLEFPGRGSSDRHVEPVVSLPPDRDSELRLRWATEIALKRNPGAGLADLFEDAIGIARFAKTLGADAHSLRTVSHAPV